MATRRSRSSDFSGSATIYAFPPRGRYALRGPGENSVVNLQLPRDAKLCTGSGWYHEEAIQDAIKGEQTQKN